ncbi:MAG: glycosyltransferase family 39 protein [Chloroflexota bacterium]|nr:glycosyltransferase family 39 protein [Chloroflexota bacterium]
MNRTGSHHIRLMILLVCLLIVYAYGVGNLKTYPIGHDETNTAFNLFSPAMDQRYNAIETLESVSTRSPQHGPLYFIVLNLWHWLAGQDLFVLRLLSVYFALIAVSVAYRIALISGHRDSALTAAILLSSLAFFLFFSHIARMYTLLPILAGWLLWSVWQVVGSSGSVARWKWISLFLSIAAIIYAHYFSIVVVAAVGAYMLLHVKKDRRWLQTVMVIAAGGLMFTPWLPVVARGLEGGAELPPVRLSLIESIHAVSSVLSNGLLFPLLGAAALALIYRRRLNERERYLMLVGSYSILAALLLNELTPILFTSRMRYVTVLAVPVCAALATALRYLPHWKTLRIPALVLWLAGCIVYSSSDEFANYAALRGQLYETGLHFQDFIYQARKLPGGAELILGMHADDNRHHSVSKVLQYYRPILSDWKHIVSIWQEADQGEGIFSGMPTYASLEAIAANSKGLWLIHNPKHTDLKKLAIYKNWLIQQYKPCKPFLESEANIIEYYIAVQIPCELRLSNQPFAISYDNGSELANIMVEQDEAALRVYAWWRKTQFGLYAYTIQLFDRNGAKVGPQSDDLIGNSGFYARRLDISTLPAGDYGVKLIVYDYVSHKSQAGTIVEGSQRFEREVEIARFSFAG